MIRLFWMSVALAGEPARYTVTADLELPEQGSALVDLTELATRANRDDLLLINGAGEEIPTRVVGSWEEQLGACAPAKWDPVGPPPRYQRIRIDTRAVGRTIDKVVLDPGSVGSGLFSGAFNVFFGDGAYAIPIEIEKDGQTIAVGLIWRANIAHAERENMTIAVDALPPGVYDIVAPGPMRWRGVDVCWTATTDVRPVRLDLEVVGPMASAPGRSRYEVILPGAGLDLIDLTLAIDDPRFAREVDVYTPRFELGGDRFVTQLLTHTAIERLALGGATIDHTVITLDESRASGVGNRIILEVEDQRDKPLSITGASARIANRALLVHDAGPGPHHLYAAPFVSQPGGYDIGHATVELLRTNPPIIRPAQLYDNPSFNPATALPAQLLTGAEADTRGYTASREVLSVAAGKPTRWPLGAATMAEVGDGLYTIRLVNADGMQVPYVLEDGGWQKISASSTREEEGSRTRIQVSLEHRARPATLVLRTDATVFSRFVSVGNGAGGSAEWESRPEDGAAMLALPLYGALDSFEVLIDNGDDAPLGEIRMEVFAPTMSIVAIDPGPGATLWYGNPNAQAPQYDLAMLADIVRLGVVAEGGLGPIVKHTRASSADKTLALVAVGVLALVLLAMAVLLVREAEEPNGAAS